MASEGAFVVENRISGKYQGAKRLENLSTPSNEVLSGFTTGGVRKGVENEKNAGNMQEAAIGFRDKSICRGAKFSDSSASSSFTRAFTLSNNVYGEIPAIRSPGNGIAIIGRDSLCFVIQPRIANDRAGIKNHLASSRRRKYFRKLSENKSFLLMYFNKVSVIRSAACHFTNTRIYYLIPCHLISTITDAKFQSVPPTTPSLSTIYTRNTTYCGTYTTSQKISVARFYLVTLTSSKTRSRKKKKNSLNNLPMY